MDNRRLNLLLSAAVAVILIGVQWDAAAKSHLGPDRQSSSRQWVDEASIVVEVDPRIELFSILFRLAGNPEYNQNRFERYVNSINAYFGALRDHPAVTYARDLRERRGIGFDAVMSFAVHVTDPPELGERVPFERSNLDERWEPSEARHFLDLARTFARDSDFQEFVRQHRELFDLAETRMQQLVDQRIDQEWFGGFFGGRPGMHFILEIGLSNGGANYGPSYRSLDGSEEVHAIIGTWLTDDEGMPVYDETVIQTVIHEFSHSFVNPIVASARERLREPGEMIFESVSHQMRNQAYGNWEIMLGESVVRAAVARYLLAQGGAASAYEELTAQKIRGFLWIDELFAVLGVYQEARDLYSTFEAFFPAVVAYFSDLGSRVDVEIEEYDASRPQIVSMSPPNGSTGVDPSLERIEFRFDRPMVPDSYSVMLVGENGEKHYPEVERAGFDATGTVFKMDVRLRPRWHYQFSLNSESGGAFKSVVGLPLKAYRVQFQTGPAEE